MTYIPTVKASNIVLNLPFSEGSGSTAKDYSGEGNDGTISDATYVKVPDGGYALNCTTATIAWSDLGTIGTKLCWKDTGTGWELDRNPSFITTTGMTSFTGKVRQIIVFDITLTTSEMDTLERQTFIE